MKDDLDQVRRNFEFGKSRQFRRRHGVDLHEPHLIAGEVWTREHFGGPCECLPNSKRDRNQERRKAGLVRNDSEKLLVKVDARAAELEGR